MILYLLVLDWCVPPALHFGVHKVKDLLPSVTDASSKQMIHLLRLSTSWPGLLLKNLGLPQVRHKRSYTWHSRALQNRVPVLWLVHVPWCALSILNYFIITWLRLLWELYIFHLHIFPLETMASGLDPQVSNPAIIRDSIHNQEKD